MMRLTISSKEDTASYFYRGRAKYLPLIDNIAMAEQQWRTRLAEAFKASGMSKRGVSLSAGKGPGYMHSILDEGKDPGIESLMAVCKELDVSVMYILYGVDITANETELLTAIRDNPARREAILALLSR